jgi:2-polyprenyl-3-methyl-5-hydroxy-6-metoxy-1,4-benzoquinol methylase
MPTIRVSIPIYYPGWLHGSLRFAKRAILSSSASRNRIDLWGDREVEWTFICSNMPEGPGEALDFGCASGYLSLMAARKGFRVTAVDLLKHTFAWRDPTVRFYPQDLLQIDLPPNHFDLVINCSSVEHVGLGGRYGISQNSTDGDLEVMRRLFELLKPNGTLLATLPCGRDTVAAPWHRVYGAERLPRLVQGYAISRQEFWAENDQNQWIKTDRETALKFVPSVHASNPHRCSYALGCFVLTKRNPAEGSCADA